MRLGGLTLFDHVLHGPDNQLQLDAQICLQGKKKLPCKRITGFQVNIASCLRFASFLFSRAKEIK